MVFHLTPSESPVWLSSDVPRFTNTNSVPKSKVDCLGQTQRSLPREQIWLVRWWDHRNMQGFGLLGRVQTMFLRNGSIIGKALN